MDPPLLPPPVRRPNVRRNGAGRSDGGGNSASGLGVGLPVVGDTSLLGVLRDTVSFLFWYEF